MPPRIDCIVVGYNDSSFDALLQRNEPMRERSGGYRHLLVSSVPYRGRRVRYGDLLNSVRREALGTADTLHVAKMPNLGVCYLVSFLRRRGLRAEHVNFFNEERGRFRDMLAEGAASVAITTTFYFDAEPIREVVDFVRRYSPSTKVIVGGPHIFNVCTDNPPDEQDRLFTDMGADVFVFDSQGELTLGRICMALRQAAPELATIPNVIERAADGRFRRGGREAENNDMDSNAVDWTLFDPSFLGPTVQTRTARSCAYKCAFCRYPVMAGSLNLESLPVIEAELDTLRDLGVEYVLFIDDTFNIPLQRFKEICRLMIRKRYPFRWFSYFRCANSDRESFDLMAQSGCAGVFLGIESGDDRILKAMNKVATVEKYRDGIRELNARDIMTYASFIIGHPPETDETARNTLAFIDEARPTFYCLETFFFDPKVPIGARAFEFGLKGRAYAWRHRTMDWRRASELVEEGYRTITGSTVVPLYSFDLWSIAYLLGHGVSRAQITRFLDITARMLIGGMDGRAAPVALDAELLSIFRPAAPAAAPAIAAGPAAIHRSTTLGTPS
jgi:radical SAM PhpK family P-methyltransferase